MNQILILALRYLQNVTAAQASAPAGARPEPWRKAMKFNDLEELLETYEKYPDLSLQVISTAIDRAGSISKLSNEAGVRRQSLALWARGSVVPSQTNVRLILDWLKGRAA